MSVVAKKKAPSAHPPYKDMITTAISALKDRKGASRQAILKYILANFKVGDNAGKLVNNALKKGLDVGSFEPSKDSRSRFKLSEASKKSVKKPVAKKVTATKASKPKKPAAKKTKKPNKPAAKTSAKSPQKSKSPSKPKPKKSPSKPKPKKSPSKKSAAKVATKKAAGKKGTPKKTLKKPAAKKTKKGKK